MSAWCKGTAPAEKRWKRLGRRGADLVLACMPRDEANLVTAMLVRRLSGARIVIRTTDMAYLDTWRRGDLDVDFVVSSEFETASAVAGLVGVPGARQADFFADGEADRLQPRPGIGGERFEGLPHARDRHLQPVIGARARGPPDGVDDCVPRDGAVRAQHQKSK